MSAVARGGPALRLPPGAATDAVAGAVAAAWAAAAAAALAARCPPPPAALESVVGGFSLEEDGGVTLSVNVTATYAGAVAVQAWAASPEAAVVAAAAAGVAPQLAALAAAEAAALRARAACAAATLAALLDGTLPLGDGAEGVSLAEALAGAAGAAAPDDAPQITGPSLALGGAAGAEAPSVATAAVAVSRGWAPPGGGGGALPPAALGGAIVGGLAAAACFALLARAALSRRSAHAKARAAALAAPPPQPLLGGASNARLQAQAAGGKDEHAALYVSNPLLTGPAPAALAAALRAQGAHAKRAGRFSQRAASAVGTARAPAATLQANPLSGGSGGALPAPAPAAAFAATGEGVPSAAPVASAAPALTGRARLLVAGAPHLNAAALAGDEWVAHLSTSRGILYYINRRSGAREWAAPAGAKLFVVVAGQGVLQWPAGTAPLTPDVVKELAGGGGWIAQDAPQPQQQPQRLQQPLQVHQQQQQQQQQQPQEVKEHSEQRLRRKEEEEEEEKADEEGGGEGPSHHSHPSLPPAPPGWTVHWSASKQAPYYANAATKQRMWRAPRAAALPAAALAAATDELAPVASKNPLSALRTVRFSEPPAEAEPEVALPGVPADAGAAEAEPEVALLGALAHAGAAVPASSAPPAAAAEHRAALEAGAAAVPAAAHAPGRGAASEAPPLHASAHAATAPAAARAAALAAAAPAPARASAAAAAPVAEFSLPVVHDELPALQAEARAWIEAITGRAFAGATFAESLADGELLISLVNAIQPGTIEKWNVAPKMAIKKKENVTQFLKAVRGLGMKEFELFGTNDLCDEKNLKVVTLSLHALGRLMQSEKFAERGLPKLGVKVVEKLKK